MAESAQDVRRMALAILQSRLMDGRLVADEFRTVLGRDHTIRASYNVAQAPGNSPKNRYVNVLPYDHNRVLLRTAGGAAASDSRPPATNGSSCSSDGSSSSHISYAAFGMGGCAGGGAGTAAPSPDYINASHVVHDDQQCGFSMRYIACQGPLASTVPDFWRMCFSEGVGAVVMLTNTVERGVTKCAPYYPQQPGTRMPLRGQQGQGGGQGQGGQQGQNQQQGGGGGGGGAASEVNEVVTLSCRSLHSGDLTHTQLALLPSGSTTPNLTAASAASPASAAAASAAAAPPPRREVCHLRYNAWPDHGTPADAAAIRTLLDLLGPVREGGSAVVVHCSAGIGRTGTFVAIDVLRRRLEALMARAEERPGSVRQEAVQSALDLPELVHSLRRQRSGMVQTLEQYAFAYQAVAEELTAALQQRGSSSNGLGSGGSGRSRTPPRGSGRR